MFAVIKLGSKQYKVAPGNKIKADKLDAKEGKEIKIADVLILEKGKKVEIGTPFVKGAKVLAKVLKQAKGDKVIVFKYKPKKRYKKKQGFRPQFTELEITKIEI